MYHGAGGHVWSE